VNAIGDFFNWYRRASSAERITALVLLGLWMMCAWVTAAVLWQIGYNLITFGTWEYQGP